jgi:hypothetical protein
MGNRESAANVSTGHLRSILKSQYHAGLAMLRETVENCPDELWESEEYANRCWQVAYHVLYFTHLYLSPGEAAFRPWKHHQAHAQHPDGIPGPADPDSNLPLIPEPYTREQVLDYWRECDQMVDEAVDRLDLHRPESGFHWYRVSKLEHQLINLRHLQHHTAQLADRLRAAPGIGTHWIGAASASRRGV